MKVFIFVLFFVCMHFAALAGENCVLPSCVASKTQVFSGRVVAVLDGDTVLIQRGSDRPFKVRLAGIDAPEKDQDYGMASKESLADLVLHNQVQVISQAVDSYGRMVAMLSLEGLSINQEQVRCGMAWAESRSRINNMLETQNEAREAQLGLWAQPNPLRPSIWRKTHVVMPNFVTQDSVCGTKSRCVQMGSCEEAKFFLMRCGVKSLDSDGDGMPCESLCAAKAGLQ